MNAITTAMVLAAGLGTRMRPITDTLPKPLIKVGGKALIDWVLDDMAAAGITTAVVNVHHLAPLIQAHVSQRARPRIIISDETAQLLETGGGIAKALPLLGDAPFLAANTDAFTVGGAVPGTAALLAAFDDSVDAVLLLHPLAQTHGFEGVGDFFRNDDGTLRRRGDAAKAPFVYAGLQIVRPEIFRGLEIKPFSMNAIWNRLIAEGRLRGVAQDGEWFHVGTPTAITETETKLARLGFGANGAPSLS